MGLLSDEEVKWSIALDEIIETLKKEVERNTYTEYNETFAGCKVYTKESQPTNKWKGVYTAEVSAENMLKGITAPLLKIRKEWDTTCIDLKELKVIEKTNDKEFHLIYSKHSPGYLLAYRDYITARKIIKTKKRIFIASKSVTPSKSIDQTEDKNCVRGEIYASAYCIDVIDDQKCKVTFISHMNLGGWIPNNVYNQLSSDQVLVPVKVEAVIKKHKK